MFWSKIWLFLVATAAAVAVTVALVLPGPPARAMVTEEQRRLTVACGVVAILLADDARKRVDLAGSFARTAEIVAVLEAASAAPALDAARMKQARDTAEGVMKGITGDRKPDFAMLVDRRGRVVARVRLDDKLFGDLAAGRPLVDDALAGYLRDDVWATGGTLYFVSASPVIRGADYMGAVVLGHRVTNELAQRLVSSLRVDLAIYLGDSTVASSRTIALDGSALQAAAGKLVGGDLARDCQANAPVPLRAGAEQLTGIVARLPGEAAGQQGFYTVYIDRPVGRGFLATLGSVTQEDLGFRTFPWLLVGGGFLAVLGVGIALMLIEADRPLRRLTAEAVGLAKGQREKLAEDVHPGRFGSIARSVNIHLDKIAREAKVARHDLDQLLGPAPEGSLGTIDLLAAARPGGPPVAAPPPPSEFRFGDASGSGSRPAIPRTSTPPPFPAHPPRTSTPPGHRIPTPPAVPVVPVAPPPAPRPAPPSGARALDDDILGDPVAAPALAPAAAPVEPYFKQVFEQFVALKRSCHESITGLTYEKFAEKLERNRDELRARTGCREVRFTVYVKDGKAALKATPVKDE